ncbi:MAG: hypothetical protein IT379_26385 [Deltaproteobacteria bacterium]|nr:hypothetical protein [Deltaproteobacteria bacterium]
MRGREWLLVLSLLAIGCAGQNASTTSADGVTVETPEPIQPPFEIREGASNLLFVFREPNGNLRNASKLADVPAERRAAVRVDSLSIPPERRLDPRYVYVADLRARGEGGRYRVVKMLREQFEAGAAIDGTMPAPAAPTAVAGSGASGSGANGDAQVTLYSTSWCGACRSAAQWMRSRNIPFVERDIERDAAARSEMQARAAQQGFVPRGVPVIDVRGTLVQGFDPHQIERLLSAAPPPAAAPGGPSVAPSAPPVAPAVPPVTGPVRPI